FGIEQPEFITLSHGNPKTDKNHDENLRIAKVFERIGAFYRENETLSTIMYKDENFHVAMIEAFSGMLTQLREMYCVIKIFKYFGPRLFGIDKAMCLDTDTDQGGSPLSPTQAGPLESG
nr:hypothetical protein [Tanacetum cinerariifolium]